MSMAIPAALAVIALIVSGKSVARWHQDTRSVSTAIVGITTLVFSVAFIIDKI